MKARILLSKYVLLVLLLITSVPIVTGSRLVAVTPPYKVTRIQAKLFYYDKGTFSRDVLAKPAFTFWNTIIGEGDAEGPSDSTLVLVEVSGKVAETEVSPTRKVELTALAGEKVILKRTVDVGMFNEQNKFLAAFWLYDTGCTPVKLNARIIGQSQPASMTKIIPFACGE